MDGWIGWMDRLMDKFQCTEADGGTFCKVPTKAAPYVPLGVSSLTAPGPRSAEMAPASALLPLTLSSS